MLAEALSPGSIYYYIIIVALLFASAFFSSCETALSSVSRIRLETKKEKGSKSAARSLKLIANYDNTLAAILIGNNIVNITASAIATIVAINIGEEGGPSAEGIATTIATIILTVLVLLFGEITPKSYAKKNSEKLLGMFSLPLTVIVIILTPVAKICTFLQRSNEEDDAATEQEMEKMLEESMDREQLDEDEATMAMNALRLDEISVEEIIIPRVDIIAVEKNMPVPQLVDLLIAQKFSRVPVYDETIDKIVGIVYEREVLERIAKGEEITLESMIRPVIYLPRTTKLSKALTQFQSEGIHMAVVTDAYSGTVGIVTMEDVLEELVGDINDETDFAQKMIYARGNRYEVNGKMSLNDLFKETDWPKKWRGDTEATTVGGWVMELVQKIPQKNELFEFEDFNIKIKSMKSRRIIAVEFIILSQIEE